MNARIAGAVLLLAAGVCESEPAPTPVRSLTRYTEEIIDGSMARAQDLDIDRRLLHLADRDPFEASRIVYADLEGTASAFGDAGLAQAESSSGCASVGAAIRVGGDHDARKDPLFFFLDHEPERDSGAAGSVAIGRYIEFDYESLAGLQDTIGVAVWVFGMGCPVGRPLVNSQSSTVGHPYL